MKKYLVFLSIILGVISCRTMPPVEPNQSASVAVGLAGIDGSLGRVDATTMFFMKVDGSKFEYAGKPVFASTYFNRQRIYLLNATPGNYVIVGFARVYVNQGRTYYYYYMLDEKSAQQTKFTLKTGQATVIGDISYEVPTTSASGDAFQSSMIQQVAPGITIGEMAGGVASALFAGQAKLGYATRIVKIDSSEQAIATLRNHMKDDFEQTNWSKFAQ